MPNPTIPLPQDWSSDYSDSPDARSRIPPQRTSERQYRLLINEYIRRLEHDEAYRDNFQDIETAILACMARLGYFDNVLDALRGIGQIRVNSRYDMNNLTHRFIVLYIGYHVHNIENFGDLVNRRPLGRDCYDPLDHIIFDRELNFLSVDGSINSPTPQEESMPYERNQQTEPIDFVINGQKIRLHVFCHYNRESRSRYIQTINLTVTSERGTHQRNVLQFERWSQIVSPLESNNVVLRRHPFQRPMHGFKFVHQIGTGRLIVKEVR